MLSPPRRTRVFPACPCQKPGGSNNPARWRDHFWCACRTTLVVNGFIVTICIGIWSAWRVKLVLQTSHNTYVCGNVIFVCKFRSEILVMDMVNTFCVHLLLYFKRKSSDITYVLLGTGMSLNNFLWFSSVGPTKIVYNYDNCSKLLTLVIHWVIYL